MPPIHASRTSLNNLAALYDAKGKYRDAEPLYRRSLALAEKALGPENPNVATALNNLAELYRTQGRNGEAEPLYTRALAIREKVLGPEHRTWRRVSTISACFTIRRASTRMRRGSTAGPWRSAKSRSARSTRGSRKA